MSPGILEITSYKAHVNNKLLKRSLAALIIIMELQVNIYIPAPGLSSSLILRLWSIICWIPLWNWFDGECAHKPHNFRKKKSIWASVPPHNACKMGIFCKMARGHWKIFQLKLLLPSGCFSALNSMLPLGYTFFPTCLGRALKIKYLLEEASIKSHAFIYSG